MYVFILILFRLATFASASDLEVSSLKYEQVSSHPSCALLKHRAKERNKVIREMVYLMELDTESSVAQIMSENTLINNKLFLDKELWNDHSSKVTFEVSISPELEKAIATYGLGKIIISIKSQGLVWVSYTDQLPESLKVTPKLKEKKLLVEYGVYISSYCKRGDELPKFAWFAPGEEIISLKNSVEARNQLMENL